MLVIDFFRAGSWIDLTYSKASLSWPKGLLRLDDLIFNFLVSIFTDCVMLQMASLTFLSPGLLWIVHVLLVIDFASVQQGLTKLHSATNGVIMRKPNTNDRPRIMFTLFTFH